MTYPEQQSALDAAVLSRRSIDMGDDGFESARSANVLDVLCERGFVKQTSDDPERLELRRLLENPTVVYYGCDATAESFHIGNQVGMMMLAWLQRYGHVPIALLGGGTTMVGDPTGRDSMRPIMTREDIVENGVRLRLQFERFIDFESGAVFLDNSAWLLKLNLIEFLRDVGTKFTVNDMLKQDAYRDRLDQKGGLSFLEFSYQLLQGYDFLHLFRGYGCRLQIGGSDQWANILAGHDLIKRAEGEDAFALTWPLITTASGEKMGKSKRTGSVWLDSAKLSPYDYYQFWINTDDANVEQFLAMFTFLPMDEVRSLAGASGADLRRAKERLALEVTTIVHGAAAAEAARQTSAALFRGGGSLDSAPTVEIQASRLDSELSIVDLITDVGLVPSKREATRRIQGGGIYFNGERVTSTDQVVDRSDLSDNREVLLRSGKKQHLRVVFVKAD